MLSPLIYKINKIQIGQVAKQNWPGQTELEENQLVSTFNLYIYILLAQLTDQSKIVDAA